MLRSAMTVIGSILPTRAHNSRCDSRSALHNTRENTIVRR